MKWKKFSEEKPEKDRLIIIRCLNPLEAFIGKFENEEFIAQSSVDTKSVLSMGYFQVDYMKYDYQSWIYMSELLECEE